jgi:hypothetical protein
LVPAERKAVLERLIPRTVQALAGLFSEPDRSYDSDCLWAETLLLVLGQYAEYGHAAVLTAITEVRIRADAALPGAQTTAGFLEVCRQRRERLHEAVLFAQASLGDATAWSKYSSDALNGTPEKKLSRLRQLSRFQPTRKVLELAIRLLDDKTEIMPYPSLPEHRRTCDLALDALAGWCSELEPLAKAHPIYDDRQLARARQVAQLYVARMQTSLGPSDHHKTVFDLSVDSRPATQRTIGSRANDASRTSHPAGTSTRIELTTKIRSTQPAAQPTTEPSAAAAK